jgi:protein-tyrosine phosphatase
MRTSLQLPSSRHTILFLCTGNYYRSRFAEALFNALAPRAGLDWVAVSRGLAPECGVHNVGPISVQVVRALQARGISISEPVRFPLRVQEQDLQQADLIVALYEEEHRPLLARRFPRWENRVEYWHIGDLDRAPADQALPEIERQVRELICRLGNESRGS